MTDTIRKEHHYGSIGAVDSFLFRIIDLDWKFVVDEYGIRSIDVSNSEQLVSRYERNQLTPEAAEKMEAQLLEALTEQIGIGQEGLPTAQNTISFMELNEKLKQVMDYWTEEGGLQ